MNLKEAFRLSNKYQELMSEAEQILENEEYTTQVKNTYLRHKVMNEAEDETVLEQPEMVYYDKITEVATFLVYLLEERGKLAAAIRKAKDALDMDMDSEISLNGCRQSIVRVLRSMNQLRDSERILFGGGQGYRFNVDGEQVAYTCDVRRVKTINFDRNVIRRELGALNKKAEEISARIDLCMITSTVSYTPPFDVGATFDEAFDTFLTSAGK